MAELPDVAQYEKDITEALISHPGWDEFLKICGREVRRMKASLISDNHPDMETLAMATTANRGGLAAINILLKELYKQAKIDVPPSVKDMFF
jgi:hypothetical protein